MSRGTPRRLGIYVAALLWLGACQERYLPVDDAGRTTAAPPQTRAPDVSAKATAPALAPAGDTCGAAALAYLIGKPKQQIPVSVDLTRRRVVCATCDRSPEVDPKRATILFDASSGLVTGVLCQ